MSETGSTYAHPYQITATGFKTRTYRTEAAMRKAAQKVANEIGREVSLWAYDRHNRLEYWGGVLPMAVYSEIKIDGVIVAETRQINLH